MLLSRPPVGQACPWAQSPSTPFTLASYCVCPTPGSHIPPAATRSAPLTAFSLSACPPTTTPNTHVHLILLAPPPSLQQACCVEGSGRVQNDVWWGSGAGWGRGRIPIPFRQAVSLGFTPLVCLGKCYAGLSLQSLPGLTWGRGVHRESVQACRYVPARPRVRPPHALLLCAPRPP